jgi:hypothetical protein
MADSPDLAGRARVQFVEHFAMPAAPDPAEVLEDVLQSCQVGEGFAEHTIFALVLLVHFRNAPSLSSWAYVDCRNADGLYCDLLIENDQLLHLKQ